MNKSPAWSCGVLSIFVLVLARRSVGAAQTSSRPLAPAYGSRKRRARCCRGNHVATGAAPPAIESLFYETAQGRVQLPGRLGPCGIAVWTVTTATGGNPGPPGTLTLTVHPVLGSGEKSSSADAQVTLQPADDCEVGFRDRRSQG